MKLTKVRAAISSVLAFATAMLCCGPGFMMLPQEAHADTSNFYISSSITSSGITRTYTGTIKAADLDDANGTVTISMTNESTKLVEVVITDTDTTSDYVHSAELSVQGGVTAYDSSTNVASARSDLFPSGCPGLELCHNDASQTFYLLGSGLAKYKAATIKLAPFGNWDGATFSYSFTVTATPIDAIPADPRAGDTITIDDTLDSVSNGTTVGLTDNDKLRFAASGVVWDRVTEQLVLNGASLESLNCTMSGTNKYVNLYLMSDSTLTGGCNVYGHSLAAALIANTTNVRIFGKKNAKLTIKASSTDYIVGIYTDSYNATTIDGPDMDIELESSDIACGIYSKCNLYGTSSLDVSVKTTSEDDWTDGLDGITEVNTQGHISVIAKGPSNNITPARQCKVNVDAAWAGVLLYGDSLEKYANHNIKDSTLTSVFGQGENSDAYARGTAAAALTGSNSATAIPSNTAITLDQPVTDGTPSFEATVGGDGSCAVAHVSWFEKSDYTTNASYLYDATALTSASQFAEKTTYVGYIEVYPTCGHAIGTGTSFTLPSWASNVALNGNVVTFEYTMPESVKQTVDIAAISGVKIPVVREGFTTDITACDQYTGTVSWAPADTIARGNYEYTAVITLTAASGYSFAGVPENFFTVAGAKTCKNQVGTGIVTATFPATADYICHTFTIDGTSYNMDTYTGVLPSGVSWDASNETLVLTNYTGGAIIGTESYSTRMNVRLVGTNTINSAALKPPSTDNYTCLGAPSGATVYLTGTADAKLAIKASCSTGRYFSGINTDVVLDGPSLDIDLTYATATDGALSYGVWNDLTVKGTSSADITIKADSGCTAKCGGTSKVTADTSGHVSLSASASSAMAAYTVVLTKCDGGFSAYAPGGTGITTLTCDTNDFDTFGNESLKTFQAWPATSTAGACSFVTISPSAYTYDGTAKKPSVSVVGLTEGTDYTVAYSNNTAVGTATATITGINSYAGYSMTGTFAIASGKVVKPTVGTTSFTYNGNVQSVSIPASVAYTISGTTSATDANNYTATVSLKSGYMWSDNTSEDVHINWSIAKAALPTTGTLEQTQYVFDNTSHTPAVTIPGLIEGTDFTVEYSNNYYVGDATAKVTGKGNYQGSYELAFQIAHGIFTADAVSLEYASHVCTGLALEPAVSVAGLAEGTDYTVAYSNNTNVGAATVTVTGIGGYEGCHVDKAFQITAIEASGASVSGIVAKIYTGSKLTQAITVKLSGTTLVEGTDYAVAYANNLNVGKATLTVTFMGNYGGTISKTFKISPKKAAVGKLKKTGKKLKVTMSKKARAYGAGGFQVAYKKAGTTKWRYKTTTKRSLTLKSLVKKKRYQVKVRAFKKVGGVKYYGAWSVVKKSRK